MFAGLQHRLTVRARRVRFRRRGGWNSWRTSPGRGVSGNWAVVGGLILAALVGLLAGAGLWIVAIALILIPVFVLATLASPEKTMLGLIVLLPWMLYPIAIGGFSVFLAMPTFGFVALILILRQRGASAVVARSLPTKVYAVLVAIAIVLAGMSSGPLTAFSRVLYLLMFALVAWAIGTAIVSGRIKAETIARTILYSGALAAVALIVQFTAQFASGRGSVLSFLFTWLPTFAGERAAGITGRNWVLDDPELLRAIFPFMSPPSSGQYMMFAFIAGVWLRNERRASGTAKTGIETAMTILCGAALLFTFSRQSWIGAGIGVMAFGFLKRPVLMAGVAAMLAAIALVVPIPGAGGGSFGDFLLEASDTSGRSASGRLDLWGQAIDLMPEHAVIGTGPGLISTLAPKPESGAFYAHNVFLDTAIELGIAGVAALIAVFLIAMRNAWRRRLMLPFALILSFVIANLFDDVLYFPRNGLILAVAFALLCAPAVRRSREHTGDQEDVAPTGPLAPERRELSYSGAG